ncbi:MAG: hypothetical protein AB4352_20890 [Hormoscilla sp.]
MNIKKLRSGAVKSIKAVNKFWEDINKKFPELSKLVNELIFLAFFCQIDPGSELPIRSRLNLLLWSFWLVVRLINPIWQRFQKDEVDNQEEKKEVDNGKGRINKL